MDLLYCSQSVEMLSSSDLAWWNNPWKDSVPFPQGKSEQNWLKLHLKNKLPFISTKTFHTEDWVIGSVIVCSDFCISVLFGGVKVCRKAFRQFPCVHPKEMTDCVSDKPAARGAQLSWCKNCRAASDFHKHKEIYPINPLTIFCILSPPWHSHLQWTYKLLGSCSL